MRIYNIASGSKGNCTYIETLYYKVLIDLGKNKKYIVDKLNEIGVNYKDIDYVFLTHTHDDHTSSIKTFLHNHKAKLVLTEKMLQEKPDLGEVNTFLYENEINIENLDIKSYKMSHDVADIRSFVITENNSSIVYITDTGYINSKYFKTFSNKTAYFIESNHDIEMLTHGPYPEWLQKRVLSDKGHLSNKFCGIYLSKMIGDNTKEVMLLHLSEKNNTPDIAINTVKEEIESFKNISLDYAYPDKISKEITL